MHPCLWGTRLSIGASLAHKLFLQICCGASSTPPPPDSGWLQVNCSSDSGRVMHSPATGQLQLVGPVVEEQKQRVQSAPVLSTIKEHERAVMEPYSQSFGLLDTGVCLCVAVCAYADGVHVPRKRALPQPRQEVATLPSACTIPDNERTWRPVRQDGTSGGRGGGMPLPGSCSFLMALTATLERVHRGWVQCAQHHQDTCAWCMAPRRYIRKWETCTTPFVSSFTTKCVHTVYQGRQAVLYSEGCLPTSIALARGLHCGDVACGAVVCGALVCGYVACASVVCGAMLCWAVVCGSVVCGAVLGAAVVCEAVSCGGALCGAPVCGAVLRGSAVCGAAVCGAVVCGVPGPRLGAGVPDSDGLLDDVAQEFSPQCVGTSALHVSLLHGGVGQHNHPLFQINRLPQLVVHRYNTTPHLLV